MQQVLRLREYDSARIGEFWNPVKGHVSERVVPLLEAVQARERAQIFAISRRSITAQNYVGTVGLGSKAIDILPKIDEPRDAQARLSLIRMLSVAGLVPQLESGEANLAVRVPTLLDAFMALYTRRLALQWRRGHIRDYLRVDSDRAYLRGKLLFSEHLRRGVVRPDRFRTRADEFIEDVPLSRLLKVALDACRRNAVSQAVRHGAAELLQDFGRVSYDSRLLTAFSSIGVDRRNERFQRVVELAKAIISRRTPDIEGPVPSYSLVFDMNIVFESFVGRLLQRIAPSHGLSVELQLGGRTLLLLNGSGRFQLRPDVGIFRGNALLALVDTKWKRLDLDKPHKGVSQADVYQMYAYGKEFQCSTVVLLYPRFGDLPERVATYLHHPGRAGSPQLQVWTVDVAHETTEQLSRLLYTLQGADSSRVADCATSH